VLDRLQAFVAGNKLTFWGYKEFDGRARAEVLSARSDIGSRILGFALKASIFLYDFVVFALLSGLLLGWVAAQSRSSGSGSICRWLAMSLALLLLLSVLAIGVEATINYAAMGSYGLAAQNPIAFASGRGVSRFVIELSTLVGIGIAAIYADTAVLVLMRCNGLGRFGGRVNFSGNVVFDSFYSVFMTFVFSSPLSPAGALGKLFIIFVSLQAVALVIVSLVAFSNSSHLSEAP
jgi:hypothetical protein